MTIQLREVMNGLAIKRYHTKRTIREQTVADHSARICAILCYLVGEPSGNLLRAAIFHDCSEFVTGDVPSPAKWRNPALKAELNRVSTAYELEQGLRVPLTDEEARLLKFADLAEGCQYCIDEIELGNRNLIPTLARYVSALTDVNQAGPNEPQNVDTWRREIILVSDYTNYLNYAKSKQ